MRQLLRVEDLGDGDIEAILQRAGDLAAGAPPDTYPRSTVGLVFLTSSLRTQVGFAAAGARLGCVPIDVTQRRSDAMMSAAESLEDTLRTVGGMLDVLVVRQPAALPISLDVGGAKLINAGDGGPRREHPTQALIDLAAVRAVGDVRSLRIGVAGDLSARTARSFVGLLERQPPALLRLMGPEVEGEVEMQREQRVERLNRLVTADLDVLYLTGLPARIGDRDFDEAERTRYALTSDAAAELPSAAVVLSPMPVIDEIAPAVRTDPRVRIFQQSDHGLSVRIAILERLLRAA